MEIEPLSTQELNSVLPLGPRALVNGSNAVPSSGESLTPHVRDATSVAASLSAWTGYPQSSPAPGVFPRPPSLLPRGGRILDILKFFEVLWHHRGMP